MGEGAADMGFVRPISIRL